MIRLCLILFGPPGSGKGTQAKFLREKFEVAHISTGDMLRERVASGDALGREVAGIMQSGGLVPDETVDRMVADRIKKPDCAKGFVLDGFPRTVNQARLLAGLLEHVQGILPMVIYLRVDYNVIVARLSGRRLCPTCGALYSLSANAPDVEVCDYDGSRLVIRDDDRPEVVLERLKAYDRLTAPVLDFFRSVNYTVCEVAGAGREPQMIAGEIRDLVEKKIRQHAGLE